MSEIKREKAQPIRRCTGCGEHFPKKTLVRVLRTPDGEIILDPTGKKSGRGAYICKSRECLVRARKSGRIEQSLGCSVSAEIYAVLEKNVENAD
ncbi:MAG: YlxR family protein [Clostridia bacterium]|nr:YlxR family protein [Clostridia bacterium]